MADNLEGACCRAGCDILCCVSEHRLCKRWRQGADGGTSWRAFAGAAVAGAEQAIPASHLPWQHMPPRRGSAFGLLHPFTISTSRMHARACAAAHQRLPVLWSIKPGAILAAQ
jgi:hypothetical protein